MFFFLSLTMLLNFSFVHTGFIAFSLFYQVSVLFNSLTKHPNDFVEVSSAFIQSWLQFLFFFFSLYFTGKAFAEGIKNTTTDPFHAFITSWNFAPTFDSEHTLNDILWAGSSDPFSEGWSACTHKAALTNIFFFTIKAFYCLQKLTFTWPVQQNKIVFFFFKPVPTTASTFN